MATAPTLAQVRAWLSLPVASMTDEQLQSVLDAETALQVAACTVPNPLPEPLYQALLRRCGRHASARGVPLGLAGDNEFGPVRLPSWDVEIERLEAPYRVIAVA